MSNTEQVVLMARQPIYDASQRLVAYELLYRSGDQSSAGVIGPEQSARALVSCLIDIGLSRLAEDRMAFFNVDQFLLSTDATELLPRNKVVLEILETVKPTPENLVAVRRLYEAGFTVALDDFDWNSDTAAFLPYANLVKLDVLQHGSTMPNAVSKLRRPGRMLLAEKIESSQQFQRCKSMGFDYYQGYHFSRPEVMQGNSIPPNKLATLQVIAKLYDPTLSLEALEELIAADLALSHRILKLVHSAQYGLSSHVTSIQQAVMFLGLHSITSLATLLVMSSKSDKPEDLLVTALVRAKTCETLAIKRGLTGKDRHYTVGMLSVIDAVMNVPMSVLLEQLPLDDEMNEALLDADCGNDLGLSLRSVLAFERGQWESVEKGASAPMVHEAYLDAVLWAATKMQTVSQPMAA